MNFVAFTYSAKFGHFLRAEANANGVTYPIPPRTVLLGLVGAVLGLEKDTPQQLLANARVAVLSTRPPAQAHGQPQELVADSLLVVGDELPKRFWHKTNVRKDPPAPLPYSVKAKDKGSSSEQRNFRFPQEWLWKPRYRVWAALPESHHSDFAARLREQRWHFGPCMGLSEMLADLSDVVEGSAELLPKGVHRVQTVAPQDAVHVDTASACSDQLTLQSLRMSVSVTPDRVFSQRAYWVEIKGRPFPVETEIAWKCNSDVVVFL